ncbi:hypothetical protein [Pontibacter sp. HSC-36F09]|uniref:hypothetical protein n=1 Tax=Pontibacter sp. HSC-36F09 TaxID=2910966 RepID=UPI00209F1561|nr:hypothetical protein [Pontibacter sp. HSC-36F09]MCP2045728.1 hypothetical protein [Pontibacter sp. HSC-36F09]
MVELDRNSEKIAVVFLTGSLQPRCDGVGDYTRLLASELIRLGHKATIISLRDTFIDEEQVCKQHEGEVEIAVLRLASKTKFKDRMERARGWIEEFNPDFTSFQFVPFAYDPKGLPFELCSRLSFICKGKLHIMFHELWVGMNEGAPIKYQLWGLLQKLLIQLLISNLKPQVIHTHTQAYQVLLNKLGYKAQFLPLFSNILLVKPEAVKIAKGGYLHELSFILFGAIHPKAPVEEFANEVREYATASGLKVRLIIAGRCGAEQQNWERVFGSVGAVVDTMGEQPPEAISKLMSEASAGIATTPLALADKSGSIMAMKVHGLPIICVSAPWKPKGIGTLKPPSGVTEYRKGNLTECLSAQASQSDAAGHKVVAHQFLSAIQGNV